MRLSSTIFSPINPTTVLTVRYGFNRFPNFDYNSSQGFNIASLGFSKAYAEHHHAGASPNSHRST